MTRLRTRSAPFTTNPEAAALIRQAQDRCAGCRHWWRLKGWHHGGPDKLECTAKEQRQALREIAARGRGK
jgi:hypothetical protein